MIKISPTILNTAVFICGLTFMFSAETFRPKRPWETPRPKRFLFHASLALINAACVALLTSSPALLFANWVRAKGFGAAPAIGLAGPAEWLASFIVLDMFDYWWHRFNHTIPFLWRFHKVHHVDTHVDATTSIRFHPGELIISSLIVKPAWIFLWGPSALGLLFFEMGLTLSAQFHHSNIDFPDRIESAVRKMIVTPRFHASHHTVSKRTREANFSAVFIFWDKIFGTYREVDAEEMKTLGLPKGRNTYLSLKMALIGPFTNNY